MDCIFCKIIGGEIPSEKVYEDEHVYAFSDINPASPVHILIIPKVHIVSANGVNADNSSVIARIFEVIPHIAEVCGVSGSGYRVVNNCGDDGGQTVGHIHFHLMGGRSLTWPPG